MKIVNLEAEIKRTCQAVCGRDRKDCRWAHYKPGEGCTVIERLEEAQPVEAIPVEWLENHDSEGNEYGRRYITVVEALSMWQSEQEAQE